MATLGQLRCARCSMVVLHVFPQIMRDLMKDSNVPPASIYNKIINNKVFMKKLNREEIHTVQTLLSDGFTKLDVSLMYKIVKYFKIYIPEPSRKWGSSPQPNEIDIGDDVERIRIARNVLVHKHNADMSKEEMESFFTTFTDVGRRVDQYLSKEGPNGYEQTIQNYRELFVDEEMAEQQLQVLTKIESLKEKCTFKAGEKVVHIYTGKTMENLTEQNSQEKGTTRLKFIIHGVENDAEKTEVINKLKEELNAVSSDIVFKQATNECIVLYVEMKIGVLCDDVKLNRAITKFLRHIFERADLQPLDNDEMCVVLTSAEDDVDAYSDLIEPVLHSNLTKFWESDNSLVLKLEVKNEVFCRPERFQESFGEFIGNLIKKTNGTQLMPQKEINVVIEPDETEDLQISQKDIYSKESDSHKTSLEDKKCSNLEFARSLSLPIKKDDAEKEDKVPWLGAQCPMDSTNDEYLINIPPKFRHLKRRSGSQDVETRPWQHFFGFRRLLELKERDSYKIVDTFSQRKTCLIDALNDQNMNQNKEILVMMLRCFAVCCQCDSSQEQLSDVFEILQYSLFLKKSVVEFIHEVVPALDIHRRDYYKSFMRDLFKILVNIKSSKPLFRECLRPIIEVIEKRKSLFNSDIFDDEMETTYEMFKLTVKDATSPKTEYEAPRNTSEKSKMSHSAKFRRVKSAEGKQRFDDEMETTYEMVKLTVKDVTSPKTEYEGMRNTSEKSKMSHSAKFRRVKSAEGKQSTLSDRFRSEIPDSQRWKLQLGFSKLSQLHLANPEDIIVAFDSNKASLREALNDDNIINEKDMVSLFLRCFGECATCESFYALKVNVFEILRDSNFLKNHVISFVGSIAIGSTTQRIISEKQTLSDIFTVFDSFNSLLPQSVPFIHSILMEMDTAINAIRAEQSALIDEDMWHVYHALMDRTKASSPKKSP